MTPCNLLVLSYWSLHNCQGLPQLIHCQFCFPNCLHISDICILAILQLLPQLVPWLGKAAALDWNARLCLWLRLQVCSWSDLELTPACGQELACWEIHPLGPMVWLLHVSSLIHYSQQINHMYEHKTGHLIPIHVMQISWTRFLKDIRRHYIRDHHHTINIIACRPITG
jgi:hypothetical protein